MKKQIFLIAYAFLMLQVVACAQHRKIPNSSEGTVYTDATSVFVKKVNFANKEVNLFSSKRNGNKNTIGFEWREPNRKYSEEALDIIEISQGVFCFSKWHIPNENERVGENAEQRKPTVVPSLLEFYADNGVLKNTYDLSRNNPYTIERYASIKHEFYYEGESGFASPEERRLSAQQNKADHYWTTTSVFETSDKLGNVGVIYGLIGLNSSGSILFKKSTFILFDNDGKQIYSSSDNLGSILGVLVLEKSNFFVINFSSNDINTNDFRDKEGIIIYDNQLKRVVHKEMIDMNIGSYGLCNSMDNLFSTGIVYASKERELFDYHEDIIIFDLKQKLRYQKAFNNTEYSRFNKFISENPNKNSLEFLINNFSFETTKI